MRRIRDYNISKALESLTGKKNEYIMDNDIALLNKIVIKNVADKKHSEISNVEDLEFLKKLPNGLEIELEGFNLKNITLQFMSQVSKIVIRDCIVDNFKVTVGVPTKGYEFVLDKIKTEDVIDFDKMAPQCNDLKIVGKSVSELTRKYTFDELNEMMTKIVPQYPSLSMNEQVILLRKNGFVEIHPQKLKISGIDKLPLLEKISLNYIEIDEIQFSKITDSPKDIRVLNEISFKECTFNEADVTYRQPVKRLVIDSCIVNRKDLLPNFTNVAAIIVINTKGMELPKLNEPKLLKGMKLIASEVKLDGIKNVKYLESLVILDQELDNLDFIKKLKKLKHLTVTKGEVKDTSLLKKRKKLNYLEIEEDTLSEQYNELFV